MVSKRLYVERYVKKYVGPSFSSAAVYIAAILLVAVNVASAQSNGDYVIGPQDVLTITVFNEEAMSGNFAVELDGTFSFPLVGRVKASELTLRQFEDELKERLSEGFLRNPQVTVGVEQYRSQRIFVVGEVRQPGTYPLTGDMTLIEALSKAGSTSIGASNEAIVVRARTGDGPDGPVLPGEDDDRVEKIRVDLTELQSGQLSQNVQLRDGDTIFVPRAETIYVFGQVKNPGGYPIPRDTTVLQALSLAGGVTEFGATGRIKIVRIVDGEETEIKVKLTDLVRPGDTIIVPERYF